MDLHVWDQLLTALDECIAGGNDEVSYPGNSSVKFSEDRGPGLRSWVVHCFIPRGSLPQISTSFNGMFPFGANLFGIALVKYSCTNLFTDHGGLRAHLMDYACYISCETTCVLKLIGGSLRVV